MSNTTHTIDRVTFPLFPDSFSEGALEALFEIVKLIVKQCGDCPERITVPEKFWLYLYKACINRGGYTNHPLEGASFYKIYIDTPFGRIEVRPE